jgi:hypothetical protein
MAYEERAPDDTQLVKFKKIKLYYSLRTQIGNLPIGKARAELEQSINEFLGDSFESDSAKRICQLKDQIESLSDTYTKLRVGLDSVETMLSEARSGAWGSEPSAFGLIDAVRELLFNALAVPDDSTVIVTS